MPENKEKIEKEVMEELEKKGVKANKEVIQGLSDLAMEGISSGMSRTAAVTLSVGGAVAMALLSGGAAWFATKKVKDKDIAAAQAEAGRLGNVVRGVANGKTLEGVDKDGNVVAVNDAKVEHVRLVGDADKNNWLSANFFRKQ